MTDGALRASSLRANEAAALRWLDIDFAYPGRPALMRRLSAEIEKGVVTSILGPNGCGKSTLVKLASGLLGPQGGSVELAGRPLLSFSGRDRARSVAVLAQSLRVPPMTVEALAFCGRHPHQGMCRAQTEEDRAAVRKALELAGVDSLRHSMLSNLSGGQRQRAYLAMVLAQDADLILLDEPTTYLDIGACHELMELVRFLNRDQGKTVAMVIHDLDLALRYSDRLIVMEEGSVAASGSVEAVLESGVLERTFTMTIRPHSYEGQRGYVLYPRSI